VKCPSEAAESVRPETWRLLCDAKVGDSEELLKPPEFEREVEYSG
jgi:hypothetical protein